MLTTSLSGKAESVTCDIVTYQDIAKLNPTQNQTKKISNSVQNQKRFIMLTYQS